MTTPDEPGSNLDASTFDLDAWIDDVVRPEVTVELYPHEIDFARKVAAIQAQIPAAEKVSAENRGMDDATAEQLLMQLDELRRERSRTALKVRVQQRTDADIAAAAARAVKAKATKDDATLWVIADACVEPNFTPAQLKRLRDRDRSGESMINQLVAAINNLAAGLPVPS